MSRIIIAVLFLAFFSINSCKSTNSRVKSLRNLSKGEAALQRNVCESDSQAINKTAEAVANDRELVQLKDGVAENYRPIIAKAISAVPENYLKFLFSKNLGVQLVFTPKAAQYCSQDSESKLYTKAGVNQLTTCMFPQQGTSVPTVYISTDIAAARTQFPDLAENSDEEVISAIIAHSSVRAIGMVFAGFVTKLSVDNSSPNTLNTEAGDEVLQKDKEDLSFLYLEDVAKGKDKGFSLGVYEGFVRDHEALSKPAANDKERQQLYTRWFTQYAQYDANSKKTTYYQIDNPNDKPEWAKRAHAFMDIVFADTFDSYYCNAQTRKEMEDFASTSKKWREIEPELLAAFDVGADAKVADSKKGEDAPANGLGLAAIDGSKVKKGKKVSPTAPTSNGASLGLLGGRFPLLRGAANLVLGVGQVGANVATGVAVGGVRVVRFVNGGPIGWRRQRFTANHSGMGPVRYFAGAPLRFIFGRRW